MPPSKTGKPAASKGKATSKPGQKTVKASTSKPANGKPSKSAKPKTAVPRASNASQAKPASKKPAAPAKKEQHSAKPTAADEASLQAVREAFEGQRWEESLKLGKQVMAANPRSGEAFTLVGKSYQHLGYPALALEPLQEALRLKPRDWESLEYLAALLETQGQWESAAALWHRRAQADPATTLWAESAARCYFRSGQSENALGYWSALLETELDPAAQAVLHYHLGMALYQLQTPGQAAIHFDQALRRGLDTPEVTLMLAETTLLAGDPAAAEERLKAFLSQHPESPRGHYVLGAALVELQDFAGARGHLEASLQQDPKQGAPWSLLAGLLSQSNEIEAAMAAYEQALALQPFPLAWQNLGNLYAQHTQWEQATRCWSEALKDKPKDDALTVLLGQGLGHQDRWAEAEKAFRKAVKLNNKVLEAWYGLGHTLIQQQAYPQAVEALLSALELSPKHGPSFAALGDACYALEAYDKAEAAYREALVIQPENTLTWQALGDTLTALHKADAAQKAYQHALSLDSDLAQDIAVKTDIFPLA